MPKTNDLTLQTYQALAEIRYRIRRFVRFSEEVARWGGLEPQQHQLLLAVKGVQPGQRPRIAYLAERLQLRHHTAVELVDRLEKKDLVRRGRGERDRREVHVTLTPRGNHALRSLTMHTRAELRAEAPGLVAALRKLTASRPNGAARVTSAGVSGRKRAISR